ncbi:MAG: hypothetical protein H6733_08780 [Alphaproteobacteria bacterium]|nr:hypothetical protein [Alphaproteobacteria bacterium]
MDTPAPSVVDALDRARAQLAREAPEDALRTLADAVPDDAVARAQVAWIRALCSAALGDVVRTQVALRQAVRDQPLPSTALDDVACAYADAVLTDSATAAAWQAVAAVVHEGLGLPAWGSPAELAWHLVAAAADAVPVDARAPFVVRLAALHAVLGHPTEAATLARAAQRTADDSGQHAVFAEASLLLAQLHHAEDAPLAHAILRHAGRRLERVADAEAQAAFTGRAADLVLTWTDTRS